MGERTYLLTSSGPAAIRNGLRWNGTAWQPAIPAMARRPILPETVTRLANPANSTLEPGHAWKFSLEYQAATSSLAYTGEGMGGLGKQCIRLATKGAGASAGVELTRLAELNLKGKHLRFWFYIPTEFASTFNTFDVVMGSGATVFKGQFKQAPTTAQTTEETRKYVKSGEWFAFTCNAMGLLGRLGSELSWEKIQDFRITLEDNKAGETQLLFGGVEIVADTYPEGVVSFTHDDNYGSQWEKIWPLFEEHGWKASLYLTMSRIGQAEKLTLEQIQHLQSIGWDVCVHCDLAEHNANTAAGMTEFSEEVVLNDLQAAQELLAELGLTGANHWAIPSGQFNREFLAFIPQLFSSARCTASNGAETVPPGDPRRLRIVGMGTTALVGNNAEVGSMRWSVKEAKEYGGWAIFLIHAMATAAEPPNTVNEKYVKELVEEIVSLGLPVRKVSEVLGV
jgi:peptidoglycan/xylan/chitin deacetylase (PgdA/CDA1 family)